MLVFSKKECEEKARSAEWILTNSLGGYANTTISCNNVKKHQGLLITEINNKKYLFLSQINEELIIDNKLVKPEIESFLLNIYPTINLKHEGIEIIKSIVMPHLHNTVIISYKIYSNKECKIRIKPYVNSRESDKISNELNDYKQIANRNTVVIKPINIKSAIIIGSDKAEYKEDSAFDAIEYSEEDYYNVKELVYNPGYFEYNIRKGLNKINIICTADSEKKAYETFNNLYSTNERYYENFFIHEADRIKSIIRGTYEYNNIKADYLLPYLIQSSNSFLKIDHGNLKIASNYPEGRENGREALIALSGLCLVTSRFEDAQKILKYYSDNMVNGLVPINIKKNGLIENNSADASLWFIYSVYKYYQYTNNLNFIKEQLWEKMRDVIHYYYYGTDHGIKVDLDGLLNVNNIEPMTWMDSNSTIRKGKAVEVNALWYNALRIMDFFSLKIGDTTLKYYRLAEQVKESFNKKFWNRHEKCLYDVITDKNNDISVRPNQIIVLGLPFRILERNREYHVLKKVTEELLTPVGLRTLSYKDHRFIGKIEKENKKTYYNGVVWGYLLGFYVTAYMRLHENTMKAIVEMEEKIMKIVKNNLKNNGIGTLSEMYEGKNPYNAIGNVSSCLSIAEITRAYVEDVLRKS
ncbi:glycogen debranching enzyme family protein [Candidatus Woesearchaeota archaeon]|nr:MAG: glycogen debranching protein [archaeon GW2011_AR18]MBS3161321.1 glycogen debranching enzyme family protein [Candidatus Woesearchaeota archaeon]HIH26276.1 hypothetical protein [Nanoarchaeota archaeon]